MSEKMSEIIDRFFDIIIEYIENHAIGSKDLNCFDARCIEDIEFLRDKIDNIKEINNE